MDKATTHIKASAGAPVRYTCLVRFPFPRGDFIDPESVEWDSVKDRQLWKIVSKAANSRDLDWNDLSQRFQVPLRFLLQQAAWLYERHFAQVKAQMQKLGTSGHAQSSNIEPLSSSHLAAGGVTASQRPESQSSRAASALSIHPTTRESPTISTSSLRQPASRFNAVTQRSPQRNTEVAIRSSSSNRGLIKQSSQSSLKASPSLPTVKPLPEISGGSSSSASSMTRSDQALDSMAKSLAFRRPPGHGARRSDDDDETTEGTSSDGFLPFANTESPGDPAETIRLDPLAVANTDQRYRDRVSTIDQQNQPGSARGADTDPGSTREMARYARDTAFTSPQLRRDLTDSERLRRQDYRRDIAGSRTQASNAPDSLRTSRLSPRLKKDGSDGAPSMGSSYSDLDGDSLTQSALEDALLSNMRQGSMASRMSTISQAIKSKYL